MVVFHMSTFILLLHEPVVMIMKEQKRILELTDFKWRLLVSCLNTARSKYIDECKPIEDVNILLIKVMSTKQKKVRI